MASSSAPDENEFQFGCPPAPCQDPSEPRVLCCTACLSENLRDDEDRICPKCRADNLHPVSPGSPLTQEKVHSDVAEAEIMCPFAGVGCSFKGSPQSMQEHEATSQSSHLYLLLAVLKEWKSSPGSNLGSAPMALERNLRVFANIVAVLNKEVEASHLALAASIHQSQLDREHILSLEQRVVELQQTLAQKDQVLGKLEHSLRLMEEASFDGTFLWKITNVTKRCHESVCGRTVSLFSPAFYTAKYGYKLCLRLYLNEAWTLSQGYGA